MFTASMTTKTVCHTFFSTFSAFHRLNDAQNSCADMEAQPRFQPVRATQKVHNNTLERHLRADDDRWRLKPTGAVSMRKIWEAALLTSICFVIAPFEVPRPPIAFSHSHPYYSTPHTSNKTSNLIYYNMAAEDTPTYSVRLTAEERERLSRYDHALDYQFSEEELLFLEENGYLVLRGIIPTETIDTLVKEAQVLLKERGVSVTNPSSWQYIPYHGCFDIWHTKTYNQLRQHPVLYSIYAQLLKTGNLTVSVDRINLKAPCVTEEACAKQAEANANLELHTDNNYWHSDPNKPTYQGGLCLQDCPIGGGGFFCLPGFQRPERIQAYMHDVNRGLFGAASACIPKKSKTFVTYLDQRDANANKVEIAMNKGDYVIWNNNLPHAGGKNSLLYPRPRADDPLTHFRHHAYIMFVPLDGPCASEEVAAFYTQYQGETRHAVMTGSPPVHFATRNRTPGSKDASKQQKVSPGPISELGEHIFGIVPWNVEE